MVANSSAESQLNSGSLYKYGDIICIKIDEVDYQKKVIFTLLRGDNPWKFDDLYNRLQ